MAIAALSLGWFPSLSTGDTVGLGYLLGLALAVRP